MSPPRCPRCGAEHDTASWARLPLVGVQEFDGDRVELRNCPCGDTIGLDLGPDPEHLAGELALARHYAPWRFRCADCGAASDRPLAARRRPGASLAACRCPACDDRARVEDAAVEAAERGRAVADEAVRTILAIGRRASWRDRQRIDAAWAAADDAGVSDEVARRVIAGLAAREEEYEDVGF